ATFADLAGASLPAGVTLDLNWAGGTSQAATVSLTARSSAWRPLTTGTLVTCLQPGVNRLDVPWATPPPTGAMTAEARLTNAAGQVLAFAAAPLAATVAGPTLELTTLPSAILHRRAGELRVRLNVPAAATGAGAWQVRLTVRDRFDRLVLDETPATGSHGGAWSVPLDRWTPITAWHQAQAELRPAAASPASPPVAVAETTFTLLPATPPWEHDGGFQLGVYGAPERQALQLQAMLPALNRAGITWYTHAYSTDALYASGGWSGAIDTFSFLPRRGLVRYAAPGAPQQVDDDQGIFTPALVPTAAAERATRDRWQERIRQAAARGAWFIGLDDERRLPADFDFSPDTLAVFQAWLARRYHGDLTALNQAWGGTTYSEFSQVQPWRRRELVGWPEAACLAPWLEFRLFFSEAAGHWYSRLPAEWAATAAPGLPVGEFGIMPPVHDTMPWPLDWSRFAGCYRVSDYYRLEENWIGDCFRSFNPAMIRGAWMGYDWQAGEAYRHAEPWQALFSGARFAWLWEMRTAGWRRDAVLAATGDLSPLYAELAAQEFPDLRGGLDRLILAAAPRDHDIAIGYSFPSQLLEPRAMGTTVRQTLHQLGYSYVLTPLAPEAPAAWRLDQARILILPALVCLSAAERTRIQTFARRGGRVIALGPNGIRNNAGNRCPPNPVTSPADDGGLLADAAPRLGGATAWTALDGAAWQAFHNALAVELTAAGLKPAAQLVDATGNPVRTGFQAWGYALPAGRGHLVAVVYTGATPVDGTLRFFRTGHQFDLRQNRELGDGDTAAVHLTTGDARVYALLDYHVTALTATLNRPTYAPGSTVKVKFRLEADHG
ncbi:MAG: alpha-amylase family protein, partial [bacterium]